MITDNDIKKLKTIFATKDDLKALDHKLDTKFATKDDLKAFATKDDLDLKVVGLVHSVELDQKLEAMESRLDKKYNKVMNVMDKVVGELQNIRDNMTMMQGHKDQLEDHEDRITALETHLHIAN